MLVSLGQNALLGGVAHTNQSPPVILKGGFFFMGTSLKFRVNAPDSSHGGGRLLGGPGRPQPHELQNIVQVIDTPHG